MQGVVLNGPGHLDERRRYVGNMNMSFAYVEGESLIMGLKVRACWPADCDIRYQAAMPACCFFPCVQNWSLCTCPRLWGGVALSYGDCV